MTKETIRKTVKHIREGRYAADVEVTWHYGSPWEPTLGPEDVAKLDRVRAALRRGDLAAASKDATIFELHPIAAE